MRPHIPRLLWLGQIPLASTNFIGANAVNIPRDLLPVPTTFPKALSQRSLSLQGAPSTTAPVSLMQNGGCQVVSLALAICASLSLGFTTLDETAQARCLCYSSTKWAPEIFDTAVQSCADYASTAVPYAYRPLVNLEGFCQIIGDVETSTSASNTTSSGSGLEGAGGREACSLINSVLNACTSLTPGFASLQATDQAKCLCYSNTSIWAPTIFDSAVVTCCGFAATAETSIYGVVSRLDSICQRVGNILATTTSPGSYARGSSTSTAIPSHTATGGAIATPSSVSGRGSTTLPSSQAGSAQSASAPGNRASGSGQSTSSATTTIHNSIVNSVSGGTSLQTISGQNSNPAGTPARYRSVTKTEVVLISLFSALLVVFLWLRPSWAGLRLDSFGGLRNEYCSRVCGIAVFRQGMFLRNI